MSRETRQHMPLRAKSAYIKGQRYRKDGSIVSARTNPVSGIAGGVSAREMEKMMMDIADDSGASYDDIVIEYYKEGDAPRESNPNPGDRHESATRATQGERYRSNWDRAFSKASGECECKGNCKCMKREPVSLTDQSERK